MFAIKSRSVALKPISHQTGIHDDQRQHGPDETLTEVGKLGSAMLMSHCSESGTAFLLLGTEAGLRFSHIGWAVVLGALKSCFRCGHGLS